MCATVFIMNPAIHVSDMAGQVLSTCKIQSIVIVLYC